MLTDEEFTCLLKHWYAYKNNTSEEDVQVKILSRGKAPNEQALFTANIDGNDICKTGWFESFASSLYKSFLKNGLIKNCGGKR